MTGEQLSIHANNVLISVISYQGSILGRSRNRNEPHDSSLPDVAIKTGNIIKQVQENDEDLWIWDNSLIPMQETHIRGRGTIPHTIFGGILIQRAYTEEGRRVLWFIKYIVTKVATGWWKAWLDR